jgi:hypothetical protein
MTSFVMSIFFFHMCHNHFQVCQCISRRFLCFLLFYRRVPFEGMGVNSRNQGCSLKFASFVLRSYPAEGWLCLLKRLKNNFSWFQTLFSFPICLVHLTEDETHFRVLLSDLFLTIIQWHIPFAHDDSFHQYSISFHSFFAIINFRPSLAATL